MAKDRTTIGKMREQVAIMTVSTVPFGDVSAQNRYTEKYVLRARVRSMEGVESRRGIGESNSERTHIAIIRYGASLQIDASNILRWDGAYYKILYTGRISKNTDDPKKRFMQLDLVYDSDVEVFGTDVTQRSALAFDQTPFDTVAFA